jgi:ferritin-like metal-binding protein YciE/uncharacterized protein (DUF433 family)
MKRSPEENRLVQQLGEAYAEELMRERALSAHIAITPTGLYRAELKDHLEETKIHAQRIRERLNAFGESGAPTRLVSQAAAQATMLSKLPLDALRGEIRQEKLLRNARDDCAGEAREVATYDALEELAKQISDTETATLCREIRAEDERALARFREAIPELSEALFRAQSRRATTLMSSTMAQATRHAVKSTVTETARLGREVPQIAQAVSQAPRKRTSTVAPAIDNYDSQSAERILSELDRLTEEELAQALDYERQNRGRASIIHRIELLREPLTDYDRLTVGQIQNALKDAGAERISAVRAYELQHRARKGVLAHTEHRLRSGSSEPTTG